MWVYVNSEPGLYTVGFYDPDGRWRPDSDWSSEAEAGARVHYLNGGGQDAVNGLIDAVDALTAAVRANHT